jgi:uncharacterized protein YbaR (Trm112 family)
VENHSFIQTKEEPIEPPKEKLICPRCKIFYEKMKTCIRCGADLVPHLPSQEKEGNEASQNQEMKQEVKQETPQIQPPPKQSTETPDEKLVCPNCRIHYRGEKICKKCGSHLVRQASPQGKKEVTLSSPPETINEKSEAPNNFPRAKETLFSPKISEQPSIKKQSEDMEKRAEVPKTRKRNYKRLFLELGSISIMIIAGGYFL